MRKLAARVGLALVGLCCGHLTAARADVKLHALFSDGMVLQQGMKVPVWGTGTPYSSATIHFQGKEFKPKQLSGDKSGEWLVYLDDLKAGGPYEMTISGHDELHQHKKLNTIQLKNVYVGEVWVCSGQSNMEWPLWLAHNAKKVIARSKNPQIRLFTVPKKVAASPQREVQGRWLECNPDTVKGFSAVAYFFGRDIQKARNVPVGLIHTSWGGTVAEAWTSQKALDADPALKGLGQYGRTAFGLYKRAAEKYLDDLEKYVPRGRHDWSRKGDLPVPPVAPGTNPNIPTGLYNGMIAPLLPYAIRGAIWYQGESNAGRAYEYRTLLPAMIKNWRTDWNQGDFPFLIVQLAPWLAISREPQESGWAELREAQLFTTQHIPNTAQAVITDLGDEKDIHPRKKVLVGARLALAARALAYKEKIVYSGPVFDKLEVNGNKAILSFKHVGGGLTADGGKLQGFTISGQDHKFHNADAEIQGDKVIVSSPKVDHPVAVRFGWANYPVVNLRNKEGLPASPFRTDDFQMLTGPKKSAKKPKP